jgi:ketosteroid isomerase-like protein
MTNAVSLRQLTLTVFNAMNTRDFSDLEQNITDDISFDFPGAGRIEGSKRVIVFLKALLRKYNQLTFHVSDVIEGKQKTCAVWTNDGEHVSGKLYSNSGITLLHFSGEKICFISDYFKDTSFVETA